MVKKFSYLVSVSVLASSLLSSASHAAFEDELTEAINNFRIQRSQPAQVASSSPSSSSSSSSEEEPSSFWSTAYRVGSSIVSPILSGTGHSLRCLGHSVRGDSPVGNLFVNKGLDLAGTVTYAAPLTKSVQADEGTLKALRKTVGNGLRYFGARMGAGETPTLARAIRSFWIKNEAATDPEVVFISTACALYRSEMSVDEIKLTYGNFTTAWYNSSYTDSPDEEQNVEYFLKGIIRGFVMNGQDMSNFDSIAPQLRALGITCENFPVTKAITAEIAIPNEAERRDLSIDGIAARVNQARRVAFMGFVEGTYNFETGRKQIGQARDQAQQLRLRSASSTPSVAPTSSTLHAIEYHPSDASPSVGENESEASNIAGNESDTSNTAGSEIKLD